MNFDWKEVLHWWYFLGASFITGIATGLASWGGLAGAKSLGVDVPELNWKAIGIIALSGGISGAIAYVQKSPIPDPFDGVSDEKNNPTSTTNPSK